MNRYAHIKTAIKCAVALLVSLPMSLSAVAEGPLGQAGEQSPLRFDASEHDFGMIAEELGAVSHIFTFTNISQQPAVIVAVKTTCGCTTVSYPRTAIAPSGRGQIEVHFDPLNYAGPFSRKVRVVTANGNASVELTLAGVVVPRPRSVDERYPLVAGGGVRMEANSHDFGFVEHGGHAAGAFGIINDSEHDVAITVDFGAASPGFYFRAPHRLAPHEQAAVNFGYDFTSGSAPYGTLHDTAVIEVDGQQAEYPLTVSAIAIDSRKKYTDGKAPRAGLSENFIKFGTVKRASPAVEGCVTVSNTGSLPLSIRAIEVMGDAFSATVAENAGTVAPQGECRLCVEFNPAGVYGAVAGRLRIVTDDPQLPVRTVRLTAEVEE